MSLKIGALAYGSVIKVMPFGALVRLESGEIGLVHISELSQSFVSDINDVVKIGDRLRVKILQPASENKLSFSAKQALCDEPKSAPAASDIKSNQPKKKVPVRPADIDWGTKNQSDMSFEDKLSKFKHDSDEAMTAIKRSNESKRSGGYKR